MFNFKNAISKIFSKHFPAFAAKECMQREGNVKKIPPNPQFAYSSMLMEPQNYNFAK